MAHSSPRTCFQHALAGLDIKHTPTSAYHSETNGQTELYNGFPIAQLCHYITNHKNNWDRLCAVPNIRL